MQSPTCRDTLRCLNSPTEIWTFSKDLRSFFKHWKDLRPLVQVEKNSLMVSAYGSAKLKGLRHLLALP